MNKEGNEVQQEPTEKKSIKARKKILFWSLLATGIGAIIVVVLLLVFLLPKEEKFEIDLDSNVSLEEGTLNGSGSYSKGDSVTIVAEDIEGYRFTGWSFNDNIISTEKEYTIVIGEDTEGEYTANYAKEYSIGIQSGNVTVAVDGGKSNAIAGEEVSFTVDAQGYRIRTVYLSCANDARIVLEAIEGKYTFTMPESDVEIIVESSKIYSVTLGEQSEYGEFNIEPMQATSGETIKVNFELKAEYIGIYSLKRLYYIMAGQGDQVTIENNRFTMPEGNVKIYAEFNNLYNVNLTTNIDEEVDLTGEGTYIENETVTISAPNVAGYRFRNWTYNNAIVTTDQEYTITGIGSATSGTYIANYDRLYSITTNSTNGTVTITDNKTEAIENESVSFTVQPDADYRLIEVKVNNETVYAQEGTYSFNMPAGDATISVTYDREYAITVDSNSSAYVQIDKQNAIAGESVEFTVSERTGYRITEVKYNETTLQSDSNTYSFSMPAEDVTIAVTYSELFDIIVTSEHGTVTIGEDKTEAIANESVSFTVQPNADYRLIEVKVNNETVYAQERTYSFNMPAEDVTIAVTYSELYDILVTSNYGTVTITDDKTEAIANESVSFTIEPSENYRIASVSINGGAVEYTTDESTYSFSMPAEDVTIAVTYSELFDIIVSSDHGIVTIAENKTEAIENESVSFTIEPSENYRIESISINSGSVEYTQEGGTYSFTMPAGLVIIAVIYDREYAITVDSNSSGYVQIEKQNAIAGESVEFTVLDRTDYRLIEVKINNETVVAEEGTYSFNMPAENVTIEVTYSELFNIVVSSDHGTVTITDNKTEAIENESIEFTVQPNADYRLIEVKVNNETVVAEEGTYSFNMPAGDVTIAVTYSELFDIIVTSEHGTVTIGESKTEAIENESVSFTVQPNADYRLIEVKVNNETVYAQEGTYSFNMPAENVTIEVTYSELFDIVVSSNHGTVTIGENKTEAIENESVSFTVQPDADYRLIEVKVNDDTVVAQEGTYSFNMPAGNATISVIYAIEYAITVDSNSSAYVQIEKQNAIAGESVEFTVSDREGYRITEVKYNNTTLQSDSNTYSFNMPAGDATISVTYSELFDIKVSSDHGTVTITDNKTEAIENESVSFTVQPNADYRLIEVKVNDETVVAQEGTYSFNMPAENVTIDVTYSQLFDISVSSDHGKVTITDNKTEAIENESVSFTVQPNADYRLIEVKVNDETVVAQEGTYSFDMPAGDATISVTYSELFDIKVSSDHGTVTITDNKTEAIANESVSFTVQPDADYRLIEVKVNDDTVVAQEGTYSFNMPSQNVTISVTYDREYAITVDSNSSAYVQIEKQNAIAGESVEFTVSDREGYRITEVKYNNTTLQSESNTYSFDMPAEDATISVTYSELFDIIVTSEHGTVTITDNKTKAIESESVSFTVQPDADYRLIEVKVNNITLQAQDGKYTFAMPAENVTIDVTYSQLFDISVTSEHGTVTITDNKTKAIESESVSFTVQPDADYRLIEVKVNDDTVVAQEGTYSFNMPSQNVTISVTYDREYAITVDSNSSAYVQIEKQNAIAGESVEFTVSDREGYRITEVKYNNTTLQSESNTYSFDMPAEDVTISVTYAIEYAVAIDSSASGKVTGVNVRTAINGEKIIVSANIQDSVEDNTVTLEGLYYIESGSEDRVPINQIDGQYSFTMPANNVTIYAESQTYRRLDDFTFSGNSITDYTGSASQLTLPAYYDTVTVNSQDYTVEKDTGTQITSIGEYAFYSCTSLTSITIPEEVTSIGSYAFEDCTSLTSITIPEGVTSIRGFAFQGCSSLTEITLPNSLTSIGSGAFQNCTSLTEITIPEGVTSIGEYAFSGCYALAIVYNNSNLEIVAGETTYGGVARYAKEVVENGGVAKGGFETIGNVQYYINSYTGDHIALAPSIVKDEITSITLAEDTTEINQLAFQSCSSLTSITLPNSLTSIGNNAFSECSSLTKITLPNSLTSIGSGAFNGCYALAIVYNNSSLEIVAGKTTYGAVARYAQEVVKNGGVAQGRFEVSNNVNYYINDVTNEKVALYVVDKGVTTVTLAEDTTEIQDYAFRDCTSLTSITIPEGVTSIGDWAFSDCTSLTSITLPNSLTSIGDWAFSDCTSLTEITIPEGVTSIGWYAFSSCTRLTEITIKSDDIYIDATGTEYNHAGRLLANAMTVRVLTTIVNTYDNSYLENKEYFTTSTSDDGKYTVFTKL